MNRAFFWTAIDKFGTQFSNLLTQLILARILAPEAFGLVAMVAIFIAVSRSIVDSGLGIALIQKKELNQKDIDTAFITNVGIAIILYLILFFVAPCIASFYDNPSLTRLTRFISITFLAQSFFITTHAILNRNYKFKEIALIDLVSALISGVSAISFAFIYRTVYAIVIFQIANMALRAILFRFFAIKVPRLSFSMKSFKALFKTSSGLLFVGVLNEVFNYLYVVTIGKVFTEHLTGLFSMANMLILYTVVSISLIIEKISVPFLSRIYHDNSNYFNKEYNTFLEVTSFLLYPVIIGIIVTAPNLIELLFDEQWYESSSLLRILACSYLFFPIIIMNITYFKISGKTKQLLLVSMFSKIFIVVNIVVNINNISINHLLWGNVIVSLINFLIYSIFLAKNSKIRLNMQIKVIFPYFVSAVFMGGILFVIEKLFNKNIFLLQLLCGPITYLTIIYLSRKQHLISLKNILIK